VLTGVRRFFVSTVASENQSWGRGVESGVGGEMLRLMFLCCMLGQVFFLSLSYYFIPPRHIENT
jgi:hypothetical protein